MSDSEDRSGDEEEQTEPEEVIQEKVLDKDTIATGLSQIAATGNGLEHAFIRCSLRALSLTDATALSAFNHLRFVDLSNNKLKTLDGCLGDDVIVVKGEDNLLSELSLAPRRYLQQLDVKQNRLESVDSSKFAQQALEQLNLADNGLSSCSLDSACLPALKTLDISGNKLSTITFRLPLMTTLDISANQLTSLNGIEGLIALRVLRASSNQLTVLDGIAALLSLEELNLQENQIEEVATFQVLAALSSLRSMDLADNPVADASDYRLEALVCCSSLRQLDGESFEREEHDEAATIRADRRQEAEAAAAAAASADTAEGEGEGAKPDDADS